eukprot:CAMPEP_0172716264 /NCGR_PEP_ID=MMETSP1074-20121228/68016_1 /TAXON_ID=2916 /ORGANISM="Ceratium fusus, Strain PA161109" /LENGTH=79 /DNA_ID=CAMNT_0013540921 /DNA_START=174 /DNA_END=413 /DNA_ORIENTATION=+
MPCWASLALLEVVPPVKAQPPPDLISLESISWLSKPVMVTGSVPPPGTCNKKTAISATGVAKQLLILSVPRLSLAISGT